MVKWLKVGGGRHLLFGIESRIEMREEVLRLRVLGIAPEGLTLLEMATRAHEQIAGSC